MSKFVLSTEYSDRLIDVIGLRNIRDVTFEFGLAECVTATVEILLTQEQVDKLLGIMRPHSVEQKP
jgi:hypothetical protein